MPVAVGKEAVTVDTVGRVKPARETVLAPEVAARVENVNERLVAGGLLKAGEVAFELDSRDYDLAVQSQRAQVERARFELAVESGQRTIAEKEWELLSDDVRRPRRARPSPSGSRTSSSRRRTSRPPGARSCAPTSRARRRRSRCPSTAT
ncbi:MAG: hypothetical protein KC635_24135 [Myxococcales bacterium]|nr:hypothetical protein [Myxococcales bacterium]